MFSERTVYVSEDGTVHDSLEGAQAYELAADLIEVLVVCTLLTRGTAENVAHGLIKHGYTIVSRDSLPHTDE